MQIRVVKIGLVAIALLVACGCASQQYKRMREYDQIQEYIPFDNCRKVSIGKVDSVLYYNERLDGYYIGSKWVYEMWDSRGFDGTVLYEQLDELFSSAGLQEEEPDDLFLFYENVDDAPRYEVSAIIIDFYGWRLSVADLRREYTIFVKWGIFDNLKNQYIFTEVIETVSLFHGGRKKKLESFIFEGFKINSIQFINNEEVRSILGGKS